MAALAELMLISLVWEYHSSFCFTCRTQTEAVNCTLPQCQMPALAPSCTLAADQLLLTWTAAFPCWPPAAHMPAPVWQFLEMSCSFLAQPDWTLPNSWNGMPIAFLWKNMQANILLCPQSAQVALSNVLNVLKHEPFTQPVRTSVPLEM